MIFRGLYFKNRGAIDMARDMVSQYMEFQMVIARDISSNFADEFKKMLDKGMEIPELFNVIFFYTVYSSPIVRHYLLKKRLVSEEVFCHLKAFIYSILIILVTNSSSEGFAKFVRNVVDYALRCLAFEDITEMIFNINLIYVNEISLEYSRLTETLSEFYQGEPINWIDYENRVVTDTNFQVKEVLDLLWDPKENFLDQKLELLITNPIVKKRQIKDVLRNVSRFELHRLHHRLLRI